MFSTFGAPFGGGFGGFPIDMFGDVIDVVPCTGCGASVCVCPTSSTVSTGRPRRQRGFLNFEGLLQKPVHITAEEQDQQYLVQVQARGLRPDSLKLNVENSTLTMSGEHADRRDPSKSVPFQRSINLPDDVDTAAIKAQFDEQTKTIRIMLPKKPQSQSKGKIEIEKIGSAHQQQPAALKHQQPTASEHEGKETQHTGAQLHGQSTATLGQQPATHGQAATHGQPASAQPGQHQGQRTL